MSNAIVVPRLMVPCPAAEELFPWMDRPTRKLVGDLLRTPKDWILMAGSKSNYLAKKLADLPLGATAFSAGATLYAGLWTAALDDTFNGATASEAAYTSYARLALTNNTTIFAAGSGSTTYTKTFPSDAAKTWATATGGSATVTYLGILDGNAGTSGDNGYYWCSVTSVSIANGDTPRLAQNAATLVED